MNCRLIISDIQTQMKRLDGQTLQAYLLTRFDRYPEPSIKSGRMRIWMFLDEQSRLVKTAVQDTRRHLTIVTNNRYDEPVDPAIFKPDFGKDVRIVDADKAFDEFVDLHIAVYVEERSGIIYAIHHLERFENGGVFVVSSVRPTEDTQKKYGKRYLSVSTGSMVGVGPAENQHGFFIGLDNWHIDLAHAEHKRSIYLLRNYTGREKAEFLRGQTGTDKIARGGYALGKFRGSI